MRYGRSYTEKSTQKESDNYGKDFRLESRFVRGKKNKNRNAFLFRNVDQLLKRGRKNSISYEAAESVKWKSEIIEVEKTVFKRIAVDQIRSPYLVTLTTKSVFISIWADIVS